MSALQIGFFSLDHLHVFSYLDCVAQNEKSAIAGIWHPDGKLGRKTARQYGCRWYAEPAKLLDKGLDAAIVCSANRAHLADTRVLAQASIPTLCEKPLGATAAEALKIARLYTKQGTLLMTAFPCRYSPPVVRARQLLSNAELGRILSISSTNRGTFPGGWFAEPRQSGGGAIVDHSVHVVDLLRWLLGTEIDSVYAESSKRLFQGKVEDTGLLMMTLSDGSVASLDTSWSRPGKRYPTWGDVTLELVGEKGLLAVDAFSQVVDLYSNRRDRGVQIPWGDSADAWMIDAFLDAVRNGAESPISGVAGLRAVEVSEAALRSARSHEVVRVQRTEV
jgi:predicted dehydrogenase